MSGRSAHESPPPSPIAERLVLILVFGLTGAQLLGIYLPCAGVNVPMWSWAVFLALLAIATTFAVVIRKK